MTDATLNLIQVAIILLCWLIERNFPRLKNRNDSIRRLFAIFVVWAASLGALAASQLFLFQALIDLLAPLKVVSISQLPIPQVVGFVLSFLFLDLCSYLIHGISHKISPLWALHSVHHADRHVTAATGLLHHPLEAVFSFIAMLCLMIFFGVSLQVIVAFSLVSTFHNLLVHANFNIPRPVECVLRWFIVTPDMHRIHHSVNLIEGNSNFGQLFPYWDRVFRTYKAEPSKPAEFVLMGLPEAMQPKKFNALQLLAQPFKSPRFDANLR